MNSKLFYIYCFSNFFILITITVQCAKGDIDLLGVSPRDRAFLCHCTIALVVGCVRRAFSFLAQLVLTHSQDWAWSFPQNFQNSL